MIHLSGIAHLIGVQSLQIPVLRVPKEADGRGSREKGSIHLSGIAQGSREEESIRLFGIAHLVAVQGHGPVSYPA